jgi:transcriptional regulator with XRE-family HTH domain
MLGGYYTAMPTEIFYYRDLQGGCAVQDFLDCLSNKDRARSLSQIDLLEGDDLPAEMDRALDDSPIRVLSTHHHRNHHQFCYVRRADQAVLLDAVRGKFSKAQQRVHRDATQRALAELHDSALLTSDHLKSHREHVAEITLNDPTLAALYSRAREHSQFAAAVVRLRSAGGFTVQTLAERTGLSQARVESMERGRMPKLATMRRLVDVLQARIVIAPGAGVIIEPHVIETKRPHRARRAATAETSTPSLTITESK